MNLTTLPFALLISLSSSLVQAQVSLHINIGLPVAPLLVEVEPGIQVVEGFREEVFFHDGWYWCRRPSGWYRAHSPRHRFSRIDGHRVPMALMREPAGHYRNWHHNRGPQARWSPGSRASHERQAPGREMNDDRYGRENSHRGKGKPVLYPPYRH